jgi:hypothetical protein
MNSSHLVLVAAVLAGVVPASAQTTYTRVAHGNWSEPSSWSPAGVPGPGDTADLNGRSVSLNAATTVAVLILPPALNSVLGGAVALTVTDTLRWEAGQSNMTDTLTVGPQATFRVRGTANLRMGNGGVLRNRGRMVWEAPQRWNDVGRFVNEGEVEIPLDGATPVNLCFSSVNPAITNAAGGLIRRTGPGTVYFSCGFNNHGTIRVEQGTLEQRGFNASGGTDTGAYEVAGGATLLFSGGVRTMTAAASVTGAGTVEVRQNGNTHHVGIAGAYAVSSTVVASGTLDLGSTSTTATLDLSGGHLGGSGSLTVSDAFNWTGGGLDGTGTTVVAPTATLAIGGTATRRLSEARTLRLEGTGTWSSPVGSLGGSTYSFHNAGTLTMSDGAGATFIEIVNTGTLTKTGGGTTDFTNLRFTNDGVVQVEAGTLNVNGCCITNPAVTDTGTFTIASGATLLFAGSRTFAPGAVVQGAGTIGFGSTSLTNRATVRPGLSPGVLAVTGSYPAPQVDGVLEVELGGYAPGTGHDQLAVTGTTALGGTLRVLLVDGFVPAMGDRFLVVAAGGAVTGAFAGLDLPVGLAAYVETTAAGVELVIGTPVASEPGANLPAVFALHGAAPNPSAGQATLRYEVARAGPVRVAVYDALGREVAVLVDGKQPAGRHEAALDGRALPSGVYLVRMTAEGFTQSHRVTLLR